MNNLILWDWNSCQHWSRWGHASISSGVIISLCVSFKNSWNLLFVYFHSKPKAKGSNIRLSIRLVVYSYIPTICVSFQHSPDLFVWCYNFPFHFLFLTSYRLYLLICVHPFITFDTLHYHLTLNFEWCNLA